MSLRKVGSLPRGPEGWRQRDRLPQLPGGRLVQVVANAAGAVVLEVVVDVFALPGTRSRERASDERRPALGREFEILSEDAPVVPRIDPHHVFIVRDRNPEDRFASQNLLDQAHRPREIGHSGSSGTDRPRRARRVPTCERPRTGRDPSSTERWVSVPRFRLGPPATAPGPGSLQPRPSTRPATAKRNAPKTIRILVTAARLNHPDGVAAGGGAQGDPSVGAPLYTQNRAHPARTEETPAFRSLPFRAVSAPPARRRRSPEKSSYSGIRKNPGETGRHRYRPDHTLHYCVSESLDALDERWKAGAFLHLMPDSPPASGPARTSWSRANASVSGPRGR